MSRRAAKIVGFAVVVLSLSACQKMEIAGVYRDENRNDLRYEFRSDGTWTAVWESIVPAGMFVQSAARRLEGTYSLRGRRLELVCTAVLERDPAGLGFVPVRVFGSDSDKMRESYGHGFVVEEGRLVPTEPDHPFGGGVLEPVANSEVTE